MSAILLLFIERVTVISILYTFLGRPCTVVTGGLIKCSWCFFSLFILSPRVLRGPSADRPETWHMIGNCLNFIIQVQKFGGPSPKKIWGPKTCKISVDFIQPPTYREYLRNGSRHLKSESKFFHIDSFCVQRKRSGELWSTSCWELVVRNEPLNALFLANYISAIRGCCALKFLHALQIGQALLAHIRTGRGSPKKI